jgi:hypothetical protein
MSIRRRVILESSDEQFVGQQDDDNNSSASSAKSESDYDESQLLQDHEQCPALENRTLSHLNYCRTSAPAAKVRLVAFLASIFEDCRDIHIHSVQR